MYEKYILERLRANSLTINYVKCHLGQSQVQFLDYTINKNGFCPLNDRILAAMSYPETINELRIFLGIINITELAANFQSPLHDFLKVAKNNDKRKVP